jgi:hypothetical protein
MAIKAQREERRRRGKEIAQDWPRTLREQLMAVRMRLEPTRRLLHRLQRAGSQVLEGLWPGARIPRTPSRTADWLEVAADRLEAWKSSVARSRAAKALEFVKAWYPDLRLA